MIVLIAKIAIAVSFYLIAGIAVVECLNRAASKINQPTLDTDIEVGLGVVLWPFLIFASLTMVVGELVLLGLILVGKTTPWAIALVRSFLGR